MENNMYKVFTFNNEQLENRLKPKNEIKILTFEEYRILATEKIYKEIREVIK